MISSKVECESRYVSDLWRHNSEVDSVLLVQRDSILNVKLYIPVHNKELNNSVCKLAAQLFILPTLSILGPLGQVTMTSSILPSSKVLCALFSV